MNPRRPHKIFGPIRRFLGRIPHPRLRNKRGLFTLTLLVAGFGIVAGVGGLMAVEYMETANFCGSCHTMDPELKAYEMSAHKEVPCAECHVAPGIGGFVKAKVNGTKQLLGVITGNFPTPILPPDHAKLPPVQGSCMKCHSLERITKNGGPVKLILRPRYKLDQANTREMVAVVIRPGGLGEAAGARGVHWHVEQQVIYTSSDERAREIDFVEIKFKDGTEKQYIAASQIGVSSNVTPDIVRLKLSSMPRRMDCIDCHNRVGHGVPNPEKAVDEAIASGQISAGLPYIKRDGVALLYGNYLSVDAADKAITGLALAYATRYPLILKKDDPAVIQAVAKLKQIYRLIATPEMKVQAQTYADNLGHQASLGCFRCHDGAHFRVVKGEITKETIPSACATCHTFPQIGLTISGLILGASPADHKDNRFVFSHKVVAKIEPAGATCSACHTRNYCENCHKSGAVKVEHKEMLFNHANAIITAGGVAACAACHQPVYCARCHDENAVLAPGVAKQVAGKRDP